MAHDWLRDLFQRWGRAPGGRAARRSVIRVESLEGRVVPASTRLADLGLSAAMADGSPRYVPGPDLLVSPTEVMAGVRGADPLGQLRAAVARDPQAAGRIALDRSTSILSVPGGDTLVQVGVAAGTDVAAAVRWLESLPGVRWANPNYIDTQDLRADFTPNDPLYGLQTHLTQIGAPAAWDTTTGKSNIVVGVLDDGVAINHADLKANLAVNTGEVPGNSKDDDGNGYVDDVTGWDFVELDNGKTVVFGDNDPSPVGFATHGTHVAGTLAGVTNNGVGVSGVAGGNGSAGSGVRILPLRALPDSGTFVARAVWPRALSYAADNGAKLINGSVSFGFADANGVVDPAVQTGLDYIDSKGALLILAAGNSSTQNYNGKFVKNVLFVSSVSSDPANPDRASDFTNFGDWTSVSAPGSFLQNSGPATDRGITATLTRFDGSKSLYGSFEADLGRLWIGTSMAAPVATGVAALIWSKNPTWTREQVAAQLLGTATNIDALNVANGKAGLLGTGRVNAARAVSETLPAPRFTGTTLPPEGGVAGPGFAAAGFSLTAPWRFASASVTAANFELRDAGPDGAFDTPDDATVPLVLNGGLAYNVGVNKLAFATPQLGSSRYRFTARSGGLRDPFGTPLDGDSNGTGGDDFVRTFAVSLPGTASGAVFEDGDGDGKLGVGEAGVAGVKVYLDANGSGGFEAGEPTATTDAGGRYSFGGQSAGAVLKVGAVSPAGWAVTPGGTAGPRAVTVPAAGTVSGVDFGFVRQGAVYGRVYQDANGNGVLNPTEPGVAGQTVLLDANGNGVYDPPTAGTASTFSLAAPVSFPALGQVSAPIDVTGVPGPVGSVLVRLNIAHPYVSTLAATLVAPDGTRVQLFAFAGAKFDPSPFPPGANFTNTVFDETADQGILFGTAPFNGRYRPQGRLSALAGRPANGRWRLELGDGAAFQPGTLTDFSLVITPQAGDQRAATDVYGRYRFDVPAGTAKVGVLQSRGWRPVNPSAFGANTPVTLAAATDTVTARDFGLLADTAAPTLAAVATGGGNPTNAAEVAFAVRFSEPVVGVTPDLFAATGLAGSTVVSVTGSGANYTVRVRPGGTGTGTLGLSLVGAGAVTDLALNPLAGPFPVAGAGTFLIDRDLPTAAVGTPAAGAVLTPATWPGRIAGTAADPTTPVASVAVSIQRPGDGAYWDGTGFNSPTEVRLDAALAAGGWELPLAGAAFAAADGRYTIRAYPTDLAGNTGEPAVAAVILDAGPPAVALTPTGGVLVNTGPIPFLFTFTEPVSGFDLSKVAVSAGRALDATSDATGRVWTVRVVRDGGSGPLTVTANPGVAADVAGNGTAAAATATVGFDATPPAVGLPAGADGQARTSAAWPGGLSGTAADDFAGVAKVAVAVRRVGTDLYWDGSAFAAAAPQFFAAAGTTDWTYQFPAGRFPADGDYQFLVQATDAAGNQALTPVAVTLDNAAPVPAIATPAAGGLVNAAEFDGGGRVSGTAADAASGPADTQVSVRREDGLYWDGTAFAAAFAPLFLPAGGTPAAWSLPSLTADRLADGQYTVTVRTADRAGNVGTAVGVFTYDNTAPVPAVAAPANGVGYSAGGWPGAVTGTVADGGDTAGVTVAVRRLADGLYWNGAFFGSADPVRLPAGFAPGTGGGGWAFPFAATGFPGEGKYAVEVAAADKAGNVGLAVSSFSFDNSAPTAAVTPLTGAAVFSPTTWPGKLTGTAADTLSGVGQVQVSVRQVATGRYFDGAGFTGTSEARLAAALTSPNATATGWAFALPGAAFPADGEYLLSVYAADVAGNAQAFATPFLFTYDAAAPQAVARADKGAVTNLAPLAFTVGFSGPVGDLDPVGVAVTNGSVLDVTRLGDSTFRVRVTPDADGAVTLAVGPGAARDAAGNPSLPSGTAVGAFDRTAPTLTLTAASGPLPLGQPLALTASFSEPVAGFGPGSLKVTNGTVLSVTGGGTSYQVQVLPAGPGPVTVGVPAGAVADPAGNSASTTVSLTRAAQDPRYAVAVGGVVRTYDAKNGLRGQVAPFGDGFTGQLRVASADFTGDGLPDTVVGSGPGRVTDVRILDGRTGDLVYQITPFEESFTGGVFVAAGDITGDGVPELVITPDEGGGPRVRVFDGAGFGQLADFFGIEDSAFRGGARAAVGDFDGDGAGDLAVAAGFGGGPRVAVFDGRSVATGSDNLQRLVGDFFVYEQTLRNGVYVAAGDLDGDGKAELVTAAGPGGGPRVTAYSGAELAAGRLTPTADFFAGDPNARDGVRVAVKPMAAGGPADLVVGEAAAATLRVYRAAALDDTAPAASFEQTLLPGTDVGGVFVG